MAFDYSIFLSSSSEVADVSLKATMLKYLTDYFEQLKTYLWSSDIITDLESAAEYSYSRMYDRKKIKVEQRRTNLAAIQADFPRLEDNFRKRIEDLESHDFNPDTMLEAFFHLNLISGLNSLNVIEEGDAKTVLCEFSGSIYEKEMVQCLYVLPNQTGLFDLEPYLRCLFDRKLLIGVPLRPLQFDNEFSSASVFMSHDLFHSFTIYYEIFNTPMFDVLKAFFHHICENTSPESSKREVLIFFLWSFIHDFNVQTDKFPYASWTDLMAFPPPLVRDFNDLLIRNKTVFWTPEIVDELRSLSDSKIASYYFELENDDIIGEPDPNNPYILFLTLVIYGHGYLATWLRHRNE